MKKVFKFLLLIFRLLLTPVYFVFAFIGNFFLWIMFLIGMVIDLYLRLTKKKPEYTVREYFKGFISIVTIPCILIVDYVVGVIRKPKEEEWN